MLAAENARND